MAKVRIKFKDPDAVTRATRQLGPSEVEVIDQYIEWDEYVTVEIDTRSGRARVVPVFKRTR